MSSQILNNNNYYTIALGSLNPYISRKLNNIDQAQVLKKEREGWTRLYHKTLKGIETMINVQRMVKDIKKMAEEANRRINPNGKHQQQDNKRYEYCTNIRGPSISGAKQYRQTNLPDPENVSR